MWRWHTDKIHLYCSIKPVYSHKTWIAKVDIVQGSKQDTCFGMIAIMRFDASKKPVSQLSYQYHHVHDFTYYYIPN